MKLSTLCFLVKGDSILLGLKKRGFGEGKWNGIGGKVTPGETILGAAIRELHEEVGVVAREEDTTPMGVLKFRSKNPEMNWDVHLFVWNEWEGEPTESEEIRPEWYKKSEIPFQSMWADDPLWLPHVLSGKKIEGSFEFHENGKDILTHTITELS